MGKARECTVSALPGDSPPWHRIQSLNELMPRWLLGRHGGPVLNPGVTGGGGRNQESPGGVVTWV